MAETPEVAPTAVPGDGKSYLLPETLEPVKLDSPPSHNETLPLVTPAPLPETYQTPSAPEPGSTDVQNIQAPPMPGEVLINSGEAP